MWQLKDRLSKRKLALGFLALVWGLLSVRLPAQSAGQAAAPVTELELAGHLGGVNAAVFVQGQYAYATFGRELAVLDITDPVHPARMGYALLPNYIGGVYVSGDYAYLSHYHGGFGNDGMIVVDVSDPTHPAEAGRAETTFGNAKAIYKLGDYVYQVNEDIGLSVIDVSDPAHPTEASWYETPGGARDVYVAGSYAYLADDEEGLAVVDVSDPLSPTLAASLPLSGTAFYIAGAGHYVYLTTNNPVAYGDNFFVVDISNPEQPALKGSEAVFMGFPGEANGVYITGNYAYVAGADAIGGGWWYGGVEMVDISDPANPTGYSFFASYWLRRTLRVHVAGGQAYLAGYDDGLLIVDVTNPTHLTKTCHYRIPSNANGLALSGQMLYLADGWQGVKTIDVTDPHNPVTVGALGPSADLHSSAQDIVLDGIHAYVADYGGGLRVLDVSDPANPAEMSYYPLPDMANYAQRLDVADGYAYVADTSGRLRIFNVADPTQPAPVTVYEEDYRSVVDVQVTGNYAYTVGDDGLRALNISDPAHPAETSHCPDIVEGSSLHVTGGYAYIVGGESGNYLWTVDVSIPLSPTVVSTYTLPVFFANAVHVTEQPTTGARLAYVNTEYNGLQVVDVSDPANPVGVGDFSAWGFGRDVQVVGGLIYLANFDEGLFVLTHPTLKVAPTTINWTVEAGGSDPAPRQVQIASTGQPISWTATLSPTVPWLDVAPLSGVTPSVITLTAHLSGLGTGLYPAQLVISAMQPILNSPQVVTVTLNAVTEIYAIYLPVTLRNYASGDTR